MMVRLAAFAVIMSLIAACASYQRIESNTTQRMGPLGITPSQEWNTVPAGNSPGLAKTWTANGTVLDSISFFVAVENGKPMMKGEKEKPFPAFKADMLPHEIVELVQSSYAIELGATITETGTLRPRQFGGQDGFEFNFRFITPDELKRRAFVAGTVRDGRLFLVAFQAAALHYYDKHLASVSRMVDTATVQ